MGLMTIPVAERDPGAVTYDSDGKLLAWLIETDLEALALDLGVTPLSTFVLDSGVFEEYPDEAHAFEERFFSVDEALHVTRRLIEAIQADPRSIQSDIAKSGSADDAIRELQTLASWLQAIGKGNRFYLTFA